eukprot:gene2290-1431_t
MNNSARLRYKRTHGHMISLSPSLAGSSEAITCICVGTVLGCFFSRSTPHTVSYWVSSTLFLHWAFAIIVSDYYFCMDSVDFSTFLSICYGTSLSHHYPRVCTAFFFPHKILFQAVVGMLFPPLSSTIIAPHGVPPTQALVPLSPSCRCLSFPIRIRMEYCLLIALLQLLSFPVPSN